jgi:hypothetical protein
MVMSALPWNLKSWYGSRMPNRQRGLELVRMEFRCFLHAIVLLPAQIVRSGRKIIYRIMGDNSWLKDFFTAWENLRRMAPAGLFYQCAMLEAEHDVPRQSYALASEIGAPKLY